MRTTLNYLTFATLIIFAFPVIAEQTIRFGVFPFLPANQLETRVGPLLIKLQEQLQRPVEFRTRKSFDDYLQALKDGSYDIALIQPFDYIQIRNQGIYVPLVRKRDLMRARIITADSDIKTLEDLRGKTIAFPSKTAAVTILSLHDLQQAGLTVEDFKPRFFNEHQSCILSAINGLSNACVTVESAVTGPIVNSTNNASIRTIKTTLAIAHILIVVKPQLVDSVTGLQDWFLSLNFQRQDQALLKNAFLDYLAVAEDRDYDLVEQVYVETLEASNHFKKTDEQVPR